MSTSISGYALQLAAHDWTYPYSDDFRVWQRGVDAEHRLLAAADNDDLMALWRFKLRQYAGVV